MPDYPPTALRAAADAIERELLSGKDYAMAQDSDEALARAALDAAAPILAEAVAARIQAHADTNEPPADSPVLYRAWRRHFGIAARVAAGAFSTEEEMKRSTAEAMTRGDFMVCRIPEGPQMPAVTQIRAWLLAHGWTPGSTGPAGTLWHSPDGGDPVGVPHDDEDPGFTAGAISRIADRGGHLADEVILEMLAAPVEGTETR